MTMPTKKLNKAAKHLKKSKKLEAKKPLRKSAGGTASGGFF
jgi:hypothetical protein